MNESQIKIKFNRYSDISWVKMNFLSPINEILDEYNKIRNNLVLHRPNDGHKDWYAVTLYGTSSKDTNSHWEYGIKSKKSVTEIGKQCPLTINWVKSLPYSRIDDIRFLVVKPYGYISEHVDVTDHNWLDPLNISLTFPDGSSFILNNNCVPYTPGACIVLNIHYPHRVINNSSTERVHLLVHGKKKSEFWNYVESYQ